MHVFAIAGIWFSFLAFLVGTSVLLRSPWYAALVERHLESRSTLAEPFLAITFLAELGAITGITILKDPMHWHAFPFLFASVVARALAEARATPPHEWMRDEFACMLVMSFYTPLMILVFFQLNRWTSLWWTLLWIPFVVYVINVQTRYCLMRWHTLVVRRAQTRIHATPNTNDPAIGGADHVASETASASNDVTVDVAAPP